MKSEWRSTNDRSATEASFRSIRHSSFHIRHLPASSRTAFTLIEIIIALTIVAVLAAGAIPMLKGFNDERQAREPVAKLVQMAREVRMRAMTEKRPYQVAFHSKGFTASRYFNPYLQLAQLQEFMDLGANPPPEDTIEKTDLDNGGGLTKTTQLTLAPPAPKYDEHWTEKYEMPPDMKYAIQHWYDAEPLFLEGNVVKLWVFQPSGICQPLKVHIERDTATFDVEFAALTADIVKESVDLR